MNKTDLTNKIAAGAGLSKVDAKKALDAAIEAVSAALKEGDKVSILGFGTFSTSVRPAHEGKNPRTGAAIKIAEKTVVKFKAGSDLDNMLN